MARLRRHRDEGEVDMESVDFRWSANPRDRPRFVIEWGRDERGNRLIIDRLSRMRVVRAHPDDALWVCLVMNDRAPDTDTPADGGEE